jgi:hypothetical protein
MTIKDDGYILGNTAIVSSDLNLIGFDIAGKWVQICNALGKLKSVTVVIDCGAYREDPSYRKIMLWTTKTESELENWLYNTSIENDYVGTFEASEYDLANHSHWVE